MTDSPILRAALDYHARGWSIIRMSMAQKRPAHKWKRYQDCQMTEANVRRQFGSGTGGIGVIFGEVSGWLASRDFDDMPAYEAWAARHSSLAGTLPTVETRRGRHVYCRTTQAAIGQLRQRLGKSGTGAIACGDGELRAGVGCYSVLPPSRHPSGHEYRWLIPLPDGPLPEVDLPAAGFVPDPMLATVSTESNGEHGGLLRTTEAMKSGFGGSGHCDQPALSNGSVLSVPLCRTDDLLAQIDRAVCESLPAGPGRRNEQVFALARALKAIPVLADATARDLRPAVRRWHELALPVIGTKPFEETWIDFLRAWPKVKFPKGAEPIARLFAAASQMPLPAGALEYEQPAVRLLVALCREIQRSAGEQPFYLSCRTAGRMLKVDHSTAARWLFLLVQDGVLVEVSKGSQSTKRASRYRYVGELWAPPPPASMPAVGT